MLLFIISTYCFFGCDVVVREPSIEIGIGQVDGKVEFEFFVYEEKWWLWQTKKVAAIGALTIGSNGRIVWEIQARQATAKVSDIKYGVVPEGFDQLNPREGSAPLLTVGHEYEVLVHARGSGRATFVYRRS
jgi:hypothetical protein